MQGDVLASIPALPNIEDFLLNIRFLAQLHLKFHNNRSFCIISHLV